MKASLAFVAVSARFPLSLCSSRSPRSFTLASDVTQSRPGVERSKRFSLPLVVWHLGISSHALEPSTPTLRVSAATPPAAWLATPSAYPPWACSSAPSVRFVSPLGSSVLSRFASPYTKIRYLLVPKRLQHQLLFLSQFLGVERCFHWGLLLPLLRERLLGKANVFLP
jgi:hypothetical protein